MFILHLQDQADIGSISCALVYDFYPRERSCGDTVAVYLAFV